MAPLTPPLTSALLRQPHRFAAAFTLLEVCLAVFVAMLIIGVALPSLSGLQAYRKAEASFAAFDELARQARARSMEERRPYVLVWEKERIVLLRDDPAALEEEPLGVLDYDGKTMPELQLTAALSPEAAPVWTFWPGGTCEPATITAPGARKDGGWQAIYHPLTVSPTVSYE